jgi:hypothetical protein
VVVMVVVGSTQNQQSYTQSQTKEKKQIKQKSK